MRLARRPSRTPTGLGRSAHRFGGSGPSIVKVEQQLSFAFLDKWIYLLDLFFSNYKISTLLLLRRGGCGNCCECLQSFQTPEERRHKLHNVGMSTCGFIFGYVFLDYKMITL